MSEIVDITGAGSDAAERFDIRASLQAGLDRQIDEGVDTTDVTADRPAASREDGRDDRGRFARKEGADAAGHDDRSGGGAGRPGDGAGAGDAGRAPGAQAEGAGDGKGEAAAPAAVSPPPGWSVASKSAWNDLPEAVKADIAKREREVSDGFRQYQGLGELKPIADAYARHGMSIKQQFDGYLQMDRVLQTNFGAGIHAICQHYGVNPAELGAFLTGKGAPANGEAPKDDPIAARLAPLEKTIMTLQQERENERRTAAEQVQTGARNEIQAFAADPKHIYFENVKVTMGHLIQTGQASDLEDAYEKATWATPEIRAQLIKQQQAEAARSQAPAQRQAAAAQARQSARSLTGSPTPGGTSATSATKPRSIREIAEDAARAQGASL